MPADRTAQFGSAAVGMRCGETHSFASHLQISDYMSTVIDRR